MQLYKLYILTEKTAPYGYEVAESITFTVSTDKETQIVEMKDMPILKSVRVEKVDGECATFRVLAANTDPNTSATMPYVATNSFFTMNLDCVCALKCLNDTTVEGV